jgi:hypothetical protein
MEQCYWTGAASGRQASQEEDRATLKATSQYRLALDARGNSGLES